MAFKQFDLKILIFCVQISPVVWPLLKSVTFCPAIPQRYLSSSNSGLLHIFNINHTIAVLSAVNRKSQISILNLSTSHFSHPLSRTSNKSFHLAHDQLPQCLHERLRTRLFSEMLYEIPCADLPC